MSSASVSEEPCITERPHWLPAESLGLWQSAWLMNPESHGHPSTPPASCSSIPSASPHQSILLSIDRTLRRDEWVFISRTPWLYWQLSASSKIKSKLKTNNNRVYRKHQTSAYKDIKQPGFSISSGYNYMQVIGQWQWSNQQLIITDREQTNSRGVYLRTRWATLNVPWTHSTN